MCGFGDFARGNLFECVDALSGWVEGVHEMHGCGFLGGSVRVLVGVVVFWLLVDIVGVEVGIG